jgi:DNA-binding PadR family transcriptional regulator
VYPALYRLETSGLLASRWTTNGGRRRRVYRLTRRGRDELSRERKEWSAFAHAVEAVVT